ncbi:hypothetical protein, partial [Bacteroides stercoris]|uniref:hypothetical protein n=1 Tax=Bacteroides stercoris TaxID=46506 RepID=UPI00326131DA
LCLFYPIYSYLPIPRRHPSSFIPISFLLFIFSILFLLRFLPVLAGWFSRREGGLPRLIPSL